MEELDQVATTSSIHKFERETEPCASAIMEPDDDPIDPVVKALKAREERERLKNLAATEIEKIKALSAVCRKHKTSDKPIIKSKKY